MKTETELARSSEANIYPQAPKVVGSQGRPNNNYDNNNNNLPYFYRINFSVKIVLLSLRVLLDIEANNTKKI